MVGQSDGGRVRGSARSVPPVLLPRRIHVEEHLALWQVRGSSSLRCDDVSVALSRDDVLWVPAGTWHALKVGQDSVVFPLFFPVPTTRTLLSTVTLARISADDRHALLTLFQSQHTIICPGVDLESRVVRLLEARAGEPAALPMPSGGVAAVVAAAILADPADQGTLVEWAGRVHSSTRTLERSFKTETGLTFRQWRAAVRMRAASRQLLAGTPVSEVTAQVGYDSPASFARAFRAWSGLSPREYAAQAA